MNKTPRINREALTIITADEISEKLRNHYYRENWDEKSNTDINISEALYLSKKLINEEFMLENFDEFSNFVPPVHFNSCVFSEETHFSGDIFLDISFSNCIFKNDVTFQDAKIKSSSFYCITFCKNVSFDSVSFSNNASFSNINFQSGSFNGSSFHKQISFEDCNIQTSLDLTSLTLENNMLTLQSMPLSKIQLGTAEIAKLTLNNCHWPKLETIKQDGIVTEQSARDWKAKSLALSDMGGMSLWHCCEKDFTLKRVKAEKDYFLLATLHCYRFISHYGESPGRAFSILAAVTIAFPLLFGLMITPPAATTTADISLGFIPYWGNVANLTNLSLPIKVFQQVWKGIIWAQLAFFGMALRNKVRR